MQTLHLTSLTSTFNPMSQSIAHRIPRLLLARLPSSPTGAGGAPIKISTKILQRGSTEPARLSVGFKGGEVLSFVEGTRRLTAQERRAALKRGIKEGVEEEAKGGVMFITEEGKLGEGELDLGKMGLNDVLEEVGRRCRVLTRRESIGGK